MTSAYNIVFSSGKKTSCEHLEQEKGHFVESSKKDIINGISRLKGGKNPLFCIKIETWLQLTTLLKLTEKYIFKRGRGTLFHNALEYHLVGLLNSEKKVYHIYTLMAYS